VYVDVTFARFKVNVTGLLNFRQLAKPCMLAAMTAAPLRGFLVLTYLFFQNIPTLFPGQRSNIPTLFPGQRSKEATKPGFFLVVLVILCYRTFVFLMHDYLCCVGIGLLYVFVVISSG